jgi:hypothetical protein
MLAGSCIALPRSLRLISFAIFYKHFIPALKKNYGLVDTSNVLPRQCRKKAEAAERRC